MSSPARVTAVPLLDRCHIESIWQFCKTTQKNAKILLGACLFVGSMASAEAAPLGLTQAFPDILVSDLALSYDGITFTAASTLSSIFQKQLGGVAISSGSYSLSVITPDLINVTGSTFNIFGDIGSGVTTLLSGVVTNAGFGGLGNPMSPGIIEFLVNITASEPSFMFGSTAGIIITTIDLVQGPPGVVTGTGNSDNFNIAAVPEPASLALLLLGGVALLGVSRRRLDV